jgi:capsular polysaccharide biosynthesis protein
LKRFKGVGVSKLYSSEYKEINVNYFLKMIAKSKINIVILTLFTTLFSAYWAYSSSPVYESNALLKIGKYHKFERDGSTTVKPLDFANELTKELSFLFIGKGSKQASIVKITAQKNVENYIEIVSEGITSKHSSGVIKNLVHYVQKEHLKILANNKKRHKVELRNIVDKVNAITNKQRKFLSKEITYADKDYTSLLNTLQLMSIINSDIGVGYIGQMLEKKEKLESLVNGEYEENTTLVGVIHTSDQPIKPKKEVIIFFGFFIGIFLSVAIVFFREYLSQSSAK